MKSPATILRTSTSSVVLAHRHVERASAKSTRGVSACATSATTGPTGCEQYRSRNGGADVQRWEYLSTWIAWFDEDEERDDLWTSSEDDTPRTQTEILAAHGAQGWELVAFTPDTYQMTGEPPDAPWEVTTYCAVFKRPAS